MANPYSRIGSPTPTGSNSDEEIELYNKLSEYIRNEYNMITGRDGRIYIFALLLLQRRMASSIYALKMSLTVRRKGSRR